MFLVRFEGYVNGGLDHKYEMAGFCSFNELRVDFWGMFGKEK